MNKFRYALRTETKHVVYKCDDKNKEKEEIASFKDKSEAVKFQNKCQRIDYEKPKSKVVKKAMRKFATGAFRDQDAQKLNYLGSLSPLALEGFVDFMRRHNIVDGKLKRDEGNWKKGFPKQSYMESKFRHFMETWKIHESYSDDEILDALYAEFFNIQGYIHVLLLERLGRNKKKKRAKKTKKIEKSNGRNFTHRN